MDNILNIHDCYGCGVCAKACGKKIINIKLNAKGFYEPYIRDEKKCIKCGLCLDVCAFYHGTISVNNLVKKSYAGWSNDRVVRKKCSSGGIAFEVAKYLLTKGYQICAVKYNAVETRAEHYIASSLLDLEQSAGSKYLQSFTFEAFNKIDNKKKYLLTGTPCQIDSFRRYIKKFRCEDNFVLLDFFCHGVPSMLVWYNYLELVENKIGRISSASWRDKITGWHDSWAMALKGENDRVYNSRLSDGDLFYKMFLKNTCLGKACYDNCKYKMMQSAADIRVGDLWGKKYSSNQEGVSGILAFTDKGVEVLKKMKILKLSTLIEEDYDIVVEGQMRRPAKRSLFWQSINNDLALGKSLESIDRRYFYFIKYYSLMRRVINKITILWRKK